MQGVVRRRLKTQCNEKIMPDDIAHIDGKQCCQEGKHKIWDTMKRLTRITEHELLYRITITGYQFQMTDQKRLLLSLRYRFVTWIVYSRVLYWTVKGAEKSQWKCNRVGYISRFNFCISCKSLITAKLLPYKRYDRWPLVTINIHYTVSLVTVPYYYIIFLHEHHIAAIIPRRLLFTFVLIQLHFRHKSGLSRCS